MVARDAMTGVLLWDRRMSNRVEKLCVHGAAVVVAVQDADMVVLEVLTGVQIGTCPDAGRGIKGLFVFEGSFLVCILSVLFTSIL